MAPPAEAPTTPIVALLAAARECREQGVLALAIRHLAAAELVGRCRCCGSHDRVTPLAAKYGDSTR